LPVEMILNPAQFSTNDRPQDGERDAAWVLRARQGDAEAFRALFGAYQGIVYRIALRMVGDADDAADLTQETFIRVYRQLSGLRDVALFGRWVRMIATNLCRDHLKRARPTIYSLDAPPPGTHDLSEWEFPSPTENGEQLAIADAVKTAMATAIGALSPDHRAVLVLHHLEGLPVDEIARTLRVPIGTVKSRLARARAEMKKHLEPYLGDS
jgi:RNA polymerase sigma-70 factor (ECF subfamily)